MAIAFDAATSVSGVLTGTTGTLSHTCSGSERLLLVAVQTTSNVDVTGCTYNGVAMTELVSSQNVFSTTWWISVFYIVAPATGANNIVATCASSVNKYISAVSYTGVDQTNPIDAYGQGTSSATPLSLTTASTIDNAWGVMLGSNPDASFDASGVNTTLRTQYFGIVGASDSNGSLGTAGSYNQTMPYGSGVRQSGGVQIMVTPATFSDVKNSSLATSLISYWELEESSGTRVDSHGSNDLTDNNTVTQGTGIQGNCADFEETNSEYLSVSNGGTFDLTAGSVSFWVNPETLRTTTYSPEIVSTGVNTGNAGFVARYSFVDQKINFFFGGAGTVYAESTTVLTAGTWYHVVCTWDTSRADVYVNGSLEGSDTGGGTLTAGASELRIGRDATTTNRYFDGLIDEVGIWSRAITSGEVSALYNSGSGIPYDAGGAAPTFTPRIIMF